jgi:hypothetical protein
VARVIIENTLQVAHYDNTEELLAEYRALPNALKSRPDITALFTAKKNEILDRPKSDNPNE